MFGPQMKVTSDEGARAVLCGAAVVVLADASQEGRTGKRTNFFNRVLHLQACSMALLPDDVDVLAL